MKKLLVIAIALVSLAGCKSKSDVKKFTVNGSISNNPAKKIYLEEIPMTTMQRVIVDSATLGANGKFTLSTGASESRAYTLRLDQQQYPLIALINDKNAITVNALYANATTQFPDSVEIKGSTASNQLKAYMLSFNKKLQEVFGLLRQGDSLTKTTGADSALRVLDGNLAVAASEIKTMTSKAIKESKDAALTMFILGYYQTTTNQQGLGLVPFDRNEVKEIVNAAAALSPDHPGLASIKSTMEGWVGKQAPDFTMPDPTGKEISLSSFKGKYVLVDFWASWCKPCRDENPNLVRAYRKYKDKNFTILGVSLDRPNEKDAWMNAVMKDSLTWTQVSDLKDWQSPVVNLYKFGESGIPYNILVDPQGKIIAERLRGEELDTRLREVLK